MDGRKYFKLHVDGRRPHAAIWPQVVQRCATRICPVVPGPSAAERSFFNLIKVYSDFCCSCPRWIIWGCLIESSLQNEVTLRSKPVFVILWAMAYWWTITQFLSRPRSLDKNMLDLIITAWEHIDCVQQQDSHWSAYIHTVINSLIYRNVFVYAYRSIAYANKVVDHAIFTKRYLGHVKKRVEKHIYLQKRNDLLNWVTLFI